MQKTTSSSERQSKAWYEEQGWHVDENNDFIDKNGNSYNYASDKNHYEFVQYLGQVPPGMWSRKLFTNGKKNQWDYAIQCPYIERALQFKWAVVLFDSISSSVYMIIGFSSGTRAALSLMTTKARDHDKVPGTAFEGVMGYL
ncbi:hypothetical protein KVV02_005392 [Mortierella alpina]|uniref:Uncharacterized protein n=1 Tax=Mortierella alpina TaxID=64518 RepID=A0A9P8CVC8_MORAP|nr:hypothetical protein KVV02_005392 [Mortierella alpina]